MAETIVEQTIAQAIAHHEAGRLGEAEALYRQVLARHWQHPNALRLMGIVAMQTGRFDSAVDWIRRAIAVDPSAAEYHVNLANALKACGDLDGAIESYRLALRLRPRYHQAFYNLGIALTEKCHLDEAIDAYRESLRLKPDYFDASTNLGAVFESAGRFHEAVDVFRKALGLKPQAANAHYNLANALRKSGQLDEAIAAYREALRFNPTSAETHNNLSIALLESGQTESAIDSCRQAVRLKPDFADAYANLGLALIAGGQPQAAVEACSHVVQLKSDCAHAHGALGNALREAGELDQAIAAHDRARNIRPDVPQAYNNLGNALREVHRFDDAAAAYRHAIELWPDDPNGYLNLGHVQFEKGRLEEALATYGVAQQLQPEMAEVHSSLGIVLAEMNRLDDAIESYRKALQLKDELPEAHFGLAIALLLRGDYEHGWQEYEWRWKWTQFAIPRPDFPQPAWHGEDPAGLTLLLRAEQGFGDTIQFVRYANLIARRGGRTILLCPAQLCRLMRGVAGLADVIADDQPPPPFDYYCSLLSLPLACATRLESIPAEIPYLRPDAIPTESWRQKLGSSDDRLRVGLAWAGKPTYKNDRNRSIIFSQLAPLAHCAGVAYYSLQKGAAAAQAADVPPGMDLIDLTSDFHDFADTAALIGHLDLIITVDTAVAHLAGAMGKKTWVLLPYKPDWRWMLEREDSPWYPTVRLFRQNTPGDWAEVINRVAEALRMRGQTAH